LLKAQKEHNLQVLERWSYVKIYFCGEAAVVRAGSVSRLHHNQQLLLAVVFPILSHYQVLICSALR
jgi:hypothetical protein